MNTDFELSAEAGNAASGQPAAKSKPLVICGACGAAEVEVDDSKTECPNCDEYIY